MANRFIQKLEGLNSLSADDVAILEQLTSRPRNDALGMTPVHINRILRELREAGAMAFTRGSLRVIDPVKLVQIVGFDENYLHRRKTRQPAVLPAC